MKEYLSTNFVWNSLATWVIVILLVLLVAYIIERFLFLHAKRVDPQQFLNGILSLLRNKRTEEAIMVCEGSLGVVPFIVKTAIASRSKTKNDTTKAVSDIVLLELPLLERRLNSINLIAKICPMISFVGVLGILSKILMMIKHTESYFSAHVVLIFVQQSMVLISLGLIANIIGTLAYSFLYGRVRRLVYDMEWSFSEITKFLEAEGLGFKK